MQYRCRHFIAGHLLLPAVAALAEDQDLCHQKRGRQQHIIQQYNAEQPGFGTGKANARQCAKDAANKQHGQQISQCGLTAFWFRLLDQDPFCQQTVEQQTVKNKDQKFQPVDLHGRWGSAGIYGPI